MDRPEFDLTQIPTETSFVNVKIWRPLVVKIQAACAERLSSTDFPALAEQIRCFQNCKFTPDVAKKNISNLLKINYSNLLIGFGI